MSSPKLTLTEAKRQILAKLDRPFKLIEPIDVAEQSGVCSVCGEPECFDPECRG